MNTIIIKPSWISFWPNFIFFWLVIPLISAIWKRNSTTLYIYGDRIRYEQGILSKRSKEVRKTDIRTIETDQGMFGKLVNIGALKIATSGTSSYEVVMAGISDPAGVRDLILRSNDISIPPEKSIAKFPNIIGAIIFSFLILSSLAILCVLVMLGVRVIDTYTTKIATSLPQISNPTSIPDPTSIPAGGCVSGEIKRNIYIRSTPEQGDNDIGILLENTRVVVVDYNIVEGDGIPFIKVQGVDQDGELETGYISSLPDYFRCIETQ